MNLTKLLMQGNTSTQAEKGNSLPWSHFVHSLSHVFPQAYCHVLQVNSEAFMKLLEHIYILTWVHNTSPHMFSALRANILELLPTNILVYCQPLKKSALFTRV